MSTTPEDNTGPENTTSASEESGRPTFEPAGVATETTDASASAPAEEADPDHEGATEVDEDVEPAAGATAEPRPGGVLSAETFGIVGLVLLGVTVTSGQLLEMLTSMILVGGQAIAPEQISHIELQLMMGGSVALLAVLSAGLSLALINAGTRPWAKWGATATVIVGLLFVAAAAVAYYMIPEAAQQMMPPIMD
ncbi:hypothetical protein [Nocardiopsis sp. MG754419]|uniref:hypothetical protein n=1 Tax=Nocardiopsis sp. MG754419 TaxID=2259865 RepID=UPI001BAA597F|nr:hypothetical protein [Nocardiopsis sp. MG754419]MBR8742840.1 hypothetical protein [Nocardiopsis sp. MG754419]